MDIMITRKKMFKIWIAKGDNSVESTINYGLLDLDQRWWNGVSCFCMVIRSVMIGNRQLKYEFGLNFARQAMFYHYKSNIYHHAGNTYFKVD